MHLGSPSDGRDVSALRAAGSSKQPVVLSPQTIQLARTVSTTDKTTETRIIARHPAAPPRGRILTGLIACPFARRSIAAVDESRRRRLRARCS